MPDAPTEAASDEIALHEEPSAPAGGFSVSVPDPRRGLLWAGAAPMDAGTGRLGGGVAGAWFATWKGLQVAGGGAEVDAAWAPTRRIAVALTVGVGTGGARPEDAPEVEVWSGQIAGFFTLAPASAGAAFASARYLAVDAPGARVAPFLAGGIGRVGAGGPIGIVGGGVAVEVPFYDVVFDLALPLGGWLVMGELPDTIPLAIGPFAPLFLLGEAGFTWTLGPHTSFRLGYVALATSYSWRYHHGPLTVEVSGHTNFLTANASTRVGWAF
ncbi:MAG: hypothetical protein V4850_37220 [Myxococcota bacterium]